MEPAVENIACCGCDTSDPANVDQCSVCNQYYCTTCSGGENMRGFIQFGRSKRVPVGNRIMNIGILDGCAGCRIILESLPACAICDANPDILINQCNKCAKYYCNNCNNRVNWHHDRVGCARRIFVDGIDIHCSNIPSCVDCDTTESFAALKKRVASQNDNRCFVCDVHASPYSLHNHCTKCIRVWCRECSVKYCAGHSYSTRGVDYGCGIEIDYKMYASCALCTADDISREKVADDTLKRLTVEETFALSGLDHNQLLATAKAHILAGACARPVKKRNQ